MRLYVSGPITDEPNYERAFEQVVQSLRPDHFVISPVEMDGRDKDKPWGNYIGRDLEVIKDSKLDGLVVLPGWWRSAGCRVEIALAEYLGLHIWHWPCQIPTVTTLYTEHNWHAPVNQDAEVIPIDYEEAGRRLSAVLQDAEVVPQNFWPKSELEKIADEMFPKQEGPLARAAPLVNGSRQKDYGHPADDFARTAGIWRSMFGWDVEPADVPLAMIGVKMSRLRQTPDHEDSETDIAGYIQCHWMTKERERAS